MWARQKIIFYTILSGTIPAKPLQFCHWHVLTKWPPLSIINTCQNTGRVGGWDGRVDGGLPLSARAKSPLPLVERHKTTLASQRVRLGIFHQDIHQPQCRLTKSLYRHFNDKGQGSSALGCRKASNIALLRLHLCRWLMMGFQQHWQGMHKPAAAVQLHLSLCTVSLKMGAMKVFDRPVKNWNNSVLSTAEESSTCTSIFHRSPRCVLLKKKLYCNSCPLIQMSLSPASLRPAQS